MKKKIIIFLSLFLFIFTLISFTKTNAITYLSDKTEVKVDLQVSGAETICQTDDGFVWIGQYAGLTRYDSREFKTFLSYNDDNGVEHKLNNIKRLVNFENRLYIATTSAVFIYDNNKFSQIEIKNIDIIIENIAINADEQLYIATNNGLILYDSKTQTYSVIKSGIINDVIIYKDSFIYSKNDGLYDGKTERKIYSNDYILDYHIANEKIYISVMDDVNKKGHIDIFDLNSNKLLDTTYDIGEQTNKLLYSKEDNILFAATDNGLYCISLDDNKITSSTDLANSEQLVDLMIDYEGNLWVVSHKSGVSIITKNALIDLLFGIDESVLPEAAREIYALHQYNNLLYIASHAGIYVYDIVNDKLIENHPLTIKSKELGTSFRDVEFFNNKLYFASYNLGILEYNPIDNDIKVYDSTTINASAGVTSSYTQNVRCMHSFGDLLVIGYSRGIMSFDGTKFKVTELDNSVLYINSDSNNNILFVYNHRGIFRIDKDLSIESLINYKDGESTADKDGTLKFLIDGNKFYYNANETLYCIENGVTTEIQIPHIKGSIVELAKVNDKYVLASQSQIYITSSLDNLMYDYEYYDSTNGLKNSIAANTSGYYDSTNNRYYFQSSNGIFIYDFNYQSKKRTPIKLSVPEVIVDNKVVTGDTINLDKYTERIVFDLSVLGFRPNKGYTIYCKMIGVDSDYVKLDSTATNISYNNLAGGSYKFHAYVLDEFDQKSNEITINIIKPKKFFEEPGFWVMLGILLIIAILAFNYFIIRRRTKKAIERQNEYKAITLESIEAIARTIDAKDSYTNGHSKRVGIYSREIARALKLPDDEIDNIYYIALLHDIGKISIPLEILNKPGRLTDEEFEIMKSHTTAGAKILDGITTIPHIVEGAKYHHERFGGGGYPTGISGEEIPFIARIICCADCYDAMATKRTYKEPYTKEKIISEFERCKGSQFDPKIADIVIKLIKEDRLRYGTELKSESKEKN